MDPLLVAYVLAFGLAAVACVGTIPRARQVEAPDTRRGLVALLATSGGWALAHLGVFVLPGYRLKLAAYIVGLVVGLSTVGAWLYFCSASPAAVSTRSRPTDAPRSPSSSSSSP